MVMVMVVVGALGITIVVADIDMDIIKNEVDNESLLTLTSCLSLQILMWCIHYMHNSQKSQVKCFHLRRKCELLFKSCFFKLIENENDEGYSFLCLFYCYLLFSKNHKDYHN